MSRLLFFFVLLCGLPPASATEYQSREDFLDEAFSGHPPKAKSLWLQKHLKKEASAILQHKPGFIRTRYWKIDNKTAWILDEIGKTEPITVGIVIENQKITRLKVLAFRESRGWEVKHDFFTDQFIGAGIDRGLTLDQPVDGISGATLSVRALNKIARLALFFDSQLHP